MDSPDGVKHYSNDEQHGLRSNFDQLNETISQSRKEMSTEMKDNLFGLMDSLEKAFTNRKIKKVTIRVQKVASQSEEIKSQTDKRIDFLEREITRLSHLEKKSSGNDPQKDNGEQKRKRGIAEKDELILLSEVELKALMKGRDCIKFIGQLVLSSFPDGYFLQKKNSFKAATSSDQMDKLFEIVSNKYKQKIQRRGHLPQRVTKEDMTKIMGQKIGNYRTKNRKLIK